MTFETNIVKQNPATFLRPPNFKRNFDVLIIQITYCRHDSTHVSRAVVIIDFNILIQPMSEKWLLFKWKVLLQM